jgi:Tetracyclin repressor-like, C-terminal domain
MRTRYTGPRRRLAVDALNRARARGQIHEEVDAEVVVDQLWGACYHRLMLTGLPITEAVAENLLDNLLPGFQAPRSQGTPTPSRPAHQSSKPRRRRR